MKMHTGDNETCFGKIPGDSSEHRNDFMTKQLEISSKCPKEEEEDKKGADRGEGKDYQYRNNHKGSHFGADFFYARNEFVWAKKKVKLTCAASR
jgi:hypothetical protein